MVYWFFAARQDNVDIPDRIFFIFLILFWIFSFRIFHIIKRIHTFAAAMEKQKPLAVNL